MPSIDTIISAALAYLLIGSLSWFALWCSGVMHQVQVRRCSPLISRVMASLWLMLLWPAVAYATARQMLVNGVRR